MFNIGQRKDTVDICQGQELQKIVCIVKAVKIPSHSQQSGINIGQRKYSVDIYQELQKIGLSQS